MACEGRINLRPASKREQTQSRVMARRGIASLGLGLGAGAGADDCAPVQVLHRAAG